MRKLLFVLVLLFAAPLAHAQKFISSSGGVLAVDCLTGTTSFKTTVFEAITSVSIVNAVPGETISIIFQQDATGHSVTFGGNVAGTPSVSSTANAVTVITLNYDSRANTWNQENSGGGTANPPGTAGAMPQFASYTFYINSGTIYARNNSTGAIDASGTDLRAVWDSISVPLATVGGKFLFQQGIYSCNTLGTESTGGFSNRYCVGIPSGGSSQYAQWILEGSGAPPLIDQFSTPVQTNGVIFNVTSTALATVTATTKVMGIWARPDVTNGVGASVFIKNIDIRVPDNQRGCETESDLSQALNSDYENTVADTAVAQNSLAFPVEASCTAWGATDPGGLIGLTTTNSSKEENQMRRSFAIGSDVGLDIRSEHAVLIQSFAINSNHGIDYGFRGSTIGAPSTWFQVGCTTTAKCLTIGTNPVSGTLLDIIGLSFEDAASGTFAPVYHALESTPGNMSGVITYSNTKEGGGGIQVLKNPFDGGGGSNFSTQSNGFFSFNGDGGCVVGIGGSAVIPCIDIFERQTGNSRPSRNLTFHATNSSGVDVPYPLFSNVDGFGNPNLTTSSAASMLTIGKLNIAASFTVATLPSAVTAGAGTVVVVTDATTFTPGTCVGGGGDFMIAVSNGTTWSCH